MIFMSYVSTSAVITPAGIASPKVGSPSCCPPLHLFTPSSIYLPPFPSLPLLPPSSPSLFTFLLFSPSIPSPSTSSPLHPFTLHLFTLHPFIFSSLHPLSPHRIPQLAPWWNRKSHLVPRLSTLLSEIWLHEAT